jgi:hypothetical protein
LIGSCHIILLTLSISTLYLRSSMSGLPCSGIGFLQWFDGYKSGIEQDVRDLHIVASGDIAVALTSIFRMPDVLA